MPDKDPLPSGIQYYLRATWARNLSLLDFLRKTNRQGETSNWFECTLDHFDAQKKCNGEQAVAATVGSRLNDPFYGQWLMLHVPFEAPRQFIDENMLQLVPYDYRYFTMAVTCGHPVAKQLWTNNLLILNECKLEGHTTKQSESILSIVRATKVLVSDYIAGRLNAAAERQRAEEDEEIVQHAA